MWTRVGLRGFDELQLALVQHQRQGQSERLLHRVRLPADQGIRDRFEKLEASYDFIYRF